MTDNTNSDSHLEEDIVEHWLFLHARRHASWVASIILACPLMDVGEEVISLSHPAGRRGTGPDLKSRPTYLQAPFP